MGCVLFGPSSFCFIFKSTYFFSYIASFLSFLNYFLMLIIQVLHYFLKYLELVRLQFHLFCEHVFLTFFLCCKDSILFLTLIALQTSYGIQLESFPVAHFYMKLVFLNFRKERSVELC